MKIIKNSFFDINSSSLICSLYTLSDSQQVLNLLNLQADVRLNVKNDDYFSKDLLKFHKLINNSVIKGFSYYLLEPILRKKYVSFFPIEKKCQNFHFEKKIYQDTLPLKKYLRKFRYNYCRYFFYQNGNFDNLPTQRKINVYGIRSLFILAGIE